MIKKVAITLEQIVEEVVIYQWNSYPLITLRDK